MWHKAISAVGVLFLIYLWVFVAIVAKAMVK